MDDYLAKPIDEGCWRSSSPTSPTGGTRITGSADRLALAVRQAAGKPALAREMLTMLLASFDEVEPILAAALEGSADDADVLAQLHRLNGGCAYPGCRVCNACSPSSSSSCATGSP